MQVLSRKLKNIEYMPDKSSALIKRIRNPSLTASIFPHGYMQCKGAASVKDTVKGVKVIVREIEKVTGGEQTLEVLDFKVTNIMAVCNFGFLVDLESLFFAQAGPFSSFDYDSERFPGLSCTTSKKVHLTIFSSGKVKFTGAAEGQIAEAFSQLYPVLLQFKKEVEA
mmetsp:Transcript_26185/g.66537  ORF Transcript_26185/g.66537 Transcript_26185/m.66537 type:complete len:167 (-) Transcript_26185:112-612(-)